jgi:hypothetical protein
VMNDLTRIAFEEGKIIAQMIGLTGEAEIPAYYNGETANAFTRGFYAERGRMARRVERATLA